MKKSRMKRGLTVALSGVMMSLVTAQSSAQSDVSASSQSRDAQQSLFTRADELYLARTDSGTSRRDDGATRFAIEQSKSRNFDPGLHIAADLPHLRMDLRITSVEYTGKLFVPPGDFIIRTYLNTDAHVENAWTDDNLQVVQTPHEDYGTLELDKLILSAVVYDGCKDSTEIKVSSNGPAVTPFEKMVDAGAVLFSTITDGPVEDLVLEDSVQGPGFYLFSFVFGFMPDTWIVRGEAPVYCTAATQPLALD